MPDNHDAVITGIGVVSPIGIGKDAFWEALLAGKSGVRQLPGSLGTITELGFGACLEDFDAKAYVRPRKALKVMCREIQTAFSAATLALADAHLDSTSLPPERIGTVFGSEMLSGEPEELIDTMIDWGVTSEPDQPQKRNFGESAMGRIFPLWMLKYLPNMATCHVGIVLGALGPNNTLLVGDTSALAAMCESVSVLRRDLADVVITGAAGTRISSTRMIFTGGLGRASRHAEIEKSSRPMAVDRDGIVGGEAAVVLVVERESSAKRRGVERIARIMGTASRFVASDYDGSFASGKIDAAIRSAFEAAMADSGLRLDQIGAIVSHSMGHPSIDAAEARVIHSLVGSGVPVVAPIASVGHTGAAAGAVGLAVGAMILQHEMIPPTLNAESLDPHCNVNLLTQATDLKHPVVVVLSHTAQGAQWPSCFPVDKLMRRSRIR